MLRLLVLKEEIRAFYGKYSMFIVPVLKFVLIYAAARVLNENVGYLRVLQEPYIPVLLALFCSVLPFSGISMVMGLYLLAHISGVSLETALFIAIFLSVVGMLYYGFKPGNSYLLIVVPLLFALRLPYVVPLVMGLCGGFASVIPVSAGIALYYFLLYIKNNVGVLTNDLAVDISQRYLQILNGILSNRLMYIMILAFSLTIIVVYLIHLLSIDYAWEIALAAGVVSLLSFIFIGEYLLNVTLPILDLALGMLLSALLAYLYKFFVFHVDYSRTEYTRFEDDDYYYYVKAVPKISVKVPDVKVQKIHTVKNGRKGEKLPDKPEEKPEDKKADKKSEKKTEKKIEKKTAEKAAEKTK